MRAGQDIHTDGGVAALKGYNPYWRLAYNHEWGANSVMVGTYGLVADRYPSNFDTSTPTDRFRDIAVDAQYQYITDPHTFTAQATYIRGTPETWPLGDPFSSRREVLPQLPTQTAHRQ